MSVDLKVPSREYRSSMERIHQLTKYRYWDWTLDWKDLSAAPIWDTFGGDGDSEGPITVHNGRCVSDGPFANHTSQWESIKVDDEFQTVANPHCLSRGFVDGKFKDVLENRVSPTSVNELVRSNDYSHFYELLEASTRYAIPQFINGDFFAPSAPNGRTALILVFVR
jgi:tyrosinase